MDGVRGGGGALERRAERHRAGRDGDQLHDRAGLRGAGRGGRALCCAGQRAGNDRQIADRRLVFPVFPGHVILSNQNAAFVEEQRGATAASHDASRRCPLCASRDDIRRARDRAAGRAHRTRACIPGRIGTAPAVVHVRPKVARRGRQSGARGHRTLVVVVVVVVVVVGRVGRLAPRRARRQGVIHPRRGVHLPVGHRGRHPAEIARHRDARAVLPRVAFIHPVRRRTPTPRLPPRPRSSWARRSRRRESTRKR